MIFSETDLRCSGSCSKNAQRLLAAALLAALRRGPVVSGLRGSRCVT
jgi:hypothetical protein